MFLTRNCATHFARGPMQPPAAWVLSKAVGTALPRAQGAASHHKHSIPKGRFWLGGAISALLALPELSSPAGHLTAGPGAVPCWSRQPAAHGQAAAQK